ncbi:abortive infection system antitoxin AbiGi family protein [Actinomadura sp. KC06]|uniref:abortive infection system antitoxin AbiGi family protein n=1 Tax=Actinomadura sp. KC06 TaxID=2530369 RepID=UPI001404E0E5|nr:abortive infection system antitoxin AbiGi family protein [Actinomadura sp. KC06]
MSEYLVHLTNQAAFQRILTDGELRASRKPFGAARHVRDVEIAQQSVCLSEIPLDYLSRLVDRRGQFGVGYAKRAVAMAGGAPVWYLRKDSPVADEFKRLVENARGDDGSPTSQNDPVWNLTPYIDFPGPYWDTEYEFEWEREWRIEGLKVNTDEVRFLFAPERHHHETARLWSGGPTPAMIDTTWPMDRIQDVLAKRAL